MVETIKKAFQHPGFAIVNVLQPCVTFNKKNTYQYYIKHVYKLDSSHDATSKTKALEVAFGVQSEKFALGVLYEVSRETYHSLAVLDKNVPLIKQTSFGSAISLAEEFI